MVVEDVKELPPFKWEKKAKCLFEHKDGTKYSGHIELRFRNSNSIPVYVVESVDKTTRVTVGEEKLAPLSESLEFSETINVKVENVPCSKDWAAKLTDSS